MTLKKKRLGRGLSSLISSAQTITEVSENDRSRMLELDVDRIHRGEYQPRQNFDETSLHELADSIRSQGIIQPIVVRREGNGYQLIAGERRWRAAQLAGLQQIPAVVRDIDPRSAAAIALIENIQREDLNPLEESRALQRLINDFDLTHQQVADSVGRSREAVSNLLRLQELTEVVQQMVNESQLSMGHARALLALAENKQIEIARQIISQGLSVRATEQLVKKQLAAKNVVSKQQDPDVLRLQRDISERLCADVKIKVGSNGSGQMIIRYHNSDELDGILQHLDKNFESTH